MNDQPTPPANPDPVAPVITSNNSPVSPDPGFKFSSLWSGPKCWLLLLAVVFAGLVIAVALTRHSSTKQSAANLTRSVAQVQVLSDKFLPALITIKAGTTITWTNKDTSPHWLASDPYPKDNRLKSLNSGGPIAAKASYSYTFNTKGTYTYHDNLNPYKLQGTVRVE